MPPETSEHAKWFSAEVLPHESDLRAYLRRAFPSLRDVDDLVQETYARIVRAKTAGKVSEARPYLFTTARNAACDLFRRSRIVPLAEASRIEQVPDAESAPALVETLERRQELELLHEAIRTLPTRCRQVLTLCRLYGLPHREVALRLGISEHTVNAQVALGVLRCRDFFRARGLL